MNTTRWASALTFVLLSFLHSTTVTGQMPVNDARASEHIWLDSDITHHGDYQWKMMKAGDVTVSGEKISLPDYPTVNWLPAIVPGTVLNSLVYNKKYPEPYYGVNNKIESKLIPDISDTGRDFYTYWFRTEFVVPKSFEGKHVWLQLDGINYRAEVWVNGNLLSTIKGMFLQDYVDVTGFVKIGNNNALAIKVYPVDVPGTTKPKSWGAIGEFRNGGNGNIGWNTTMLMTVGWDFTFMDGIRDRNTGIWKHVSLYSTGKVALRHPFVKSELRKPGYDQAREFVSVEVVNPTTGSNPIHCTVKGEIMGEGIIFEKNLGILRGEE